MPATPPPTLDDQQPKDVPQSGKERVLGAIGGVLSAGGGRDKSESPLVQAMDKHHRERVTLAQKHYKDFQTYHAAISTGVDPETDEPLKAQAAEDYYTKMNAAWAELEKTAGVNKDVKSKLQKFKMIADHIVKIHPKAGGDSAGGAAGGAGGGGAGTTDGKQADAGGGTRMTPPPSQSQSAMDDLKQNADAPRLRQEQADNREFNLWKREQQALKDFKIEEEKAKSAAKESTARTTYGPAISVQNARTLAQQGKTYLDKDGKQIDLTSMPDSMGLKFISRGGNNYYEPFSPNSKVISVGNETYAVSPMDVEALGQGAGTDLGVKNTPRSSAHEAIGVDAHGNPVKNVLGSTSTPQTTGAKGRPDSRTTPPPKLGQSGAGGSAPVAMTPGMYKQQTDRAIPVREAATALFGDPANPNLPSLKDYASIADNPQSRSKVAKALNLTFDELDRQEKQAGSLLTLIERYGGVPQALAESKARITGDAIKELSPKERDSYDALMSAYGAVIGLRSLTKASGAQFSVRKIEQELPLPGINSMSSAQYYDQLARLARQVHNATQTIGDAAMPKDEKEHYRKQMDELLKLKEGSGKQKSRMSTPPKSGPKSVDDEIMEAVGAAKGSGKP